MTGNEKALLDYAVSQGITGQELAAFMAQTGHESTSFSRVKEGGLSSKNIQSILDRDTDGKRMDPSGKVRLRFIKDGINSTSGSVAAQNSQYRDNVGPGNGDYSSGDGSKFAGKGYIQITGRSNYEKMGKAIGEDLVNKPELLLDPTIARKASVQWWKDNVRPKNPDYNDNKVVTKIVNGGYNGLTDRKKRLDKYTESPIISVRPRLRPEVSVPATQELPTTVPPVTYTTANNGVDAAVREANQPVPQVQTQQRVAIDSAVAEALQNPTGFPVSNMPDIPAGYNQGTSGIPMPEEGLAQQHLYEEYLRRMSEVQQPLPAPPPVTTTTLPPAQYNDGTEGVSWLDSLRSLFARVPSGPELRQVTTDARNEAYNINGVNTGTGLQVGDGNLLPPSVPQAANSNVPLNYGVPKPGQGYGIENFGEGNIFTNGVQQQAEVPQAEVPQAVTPEGPFLNIPRNLGRGSTLEEAQAAAMERGYVPAPQVTVPQATTTEFVPQAMPGQQVQAGMGNARMPDNYSGNAVPLPGRNLDLAMGDDGRQRISAKYLDLPVVSEAMALNRQNDGGGTYFRDGDKVKYVATGSVPEVDPTAYKVVTNRSGAVQSVNPNRIDPEKMATITQRFADGKITEEQYQNQKTDYENAILQDNAHKAYLLTQQEKVAADKIESNKVEAAVLDDRIAAAVTAGDTALADALRKKKDALVTSLPPEEKVYSGRGDLGMPEPVVVTEKDDVNVPEGIAEDAISNSTGVIPDPSKEDIEGAARGLGTTFENISTKVGPLLKQFFGLDTSDVTRAIGFYIMSRATGASHAGSMRWAGSTVLKQAEARKIRGSARADAAAKAFNALAGNYTKVAASKIRSALAKGNIVEAQSLMDAAENKTARGKLGIDANATGTFYMMPGYTNAVEVFEGTGGNRYTKVTKTENGKTVEAYVPISSEQMGGLRERNQDDDITSYLAAVRSHVNTMDPNLFKEEYTDDNGEVVRPDGIFAGRNKAGVTEDIMKISRQQKAKGLPDDPREIMMMVSGSASLAKAMGVKTINAETLFEMQTVGGDILFDQSKISKEGELVPSSKIKSFTTDFQEILGGDRGLITTTMNTAAGQFNPEITMDSIKATTNYSSLSKSEKSKVDSAPSSFMALALLTAYENKPK